MSNSYDFFMRGEEILSGAHDNLPESAFYMVGTIEDVKAKAEQLAKEMGESS